MYFSITSGKRDTWQVKKKANDLAECCSERMSYHNERAKFWKGELLSAEEKLRSEGITVKHFPVTGGNRTEAQLDQSLANRVGECQKKVEANQSSLRRFQAFMAFFNLCEGEEFSLNVDDVLYFNIGQADSPSDEE